MGSIGFGILWLSLKNLETKLKRLSSLEQFLSNPYAIWLRYASTLEKMHNIFENRVLGCISPENSDCADTSYNLFCIVIHWTMTQSGSNQLNHCTQFSESQWKVCVRWIKYAGAYTHLHNLCNQGSNYIRLRARPQWPWSFRISEGTKAMLWGT